MSNKFDPEERIDFTSDPRLSPKVRAAWKETAALSTRLIDVLERLGIHGELGWPQLMKAWCSVNLPKEDFARMASPFDLIPVLEAKADLLDGIRNRGNPTSRTVLKKAGMLGGRPARLFMDAAEARRIRGDLTFAEFARTLDVDETTIANWEKDGVKTKGNLKKLQQHRNNSLILTRKEPPKKPK